MAAAINSDDRRWSPARCMFMLYYGAALADRQMSHEEATALAALVARAPSLHELSDDVVARMTDEVIEAHQNNRMAAITQRALQDLPRDEALAVAVYANCADIIRADRSVRGSERRFMQQLSQTLKVPRSKAALIDKVMDSKNRH